MGQITMQNIAKDVALTCDFGRDVAYVRYVNKNVASVRYFG